ncbi:MAG: azurin [Puniceicoccaceae bacterium]|nr:MAG: azurin [Puniceicoccaceae bacterium]
MIRLTSSATLLALGLAGLLAFAACGGNGETADIVPDGGSIVITGDDMMRFDPTEFTVQAGTTVSVVFRNIGVMPKEAMGHNLAILLPGTDANSFSAAATRHPANEYIAPEYEDRVLATTKILGPGEEETLTFTVPAETGDYPFVCSFPMHTPAGMVGVMRVVP